MSPHVQVLQVLQVLQVRHLSVTGTRPPLCPLQLPLSAGRVLRAGVSACYRRATAGRVGEWAGALTVVWVCIGCTRRAARTRVRPLQLPISYQSQSALVVLGPSIHQRARVCSRDFVSRTPGATSINGSIDSRGSETDRPGFWQRRVSVKRSYGFWFT